MKAKYPWGSKEHKELGEKLRAFEEAHTKWMGLSIWSEKGRAARIEKDAAMAAYDEAARNYYEGWKAADLEKGK